MKTVIYYRAGWKPKTLYVAAENKDGSLDLADEQGAVVVQGCPLADVPTDGHATCGEMNGSAKKVAKKKVKGGE